MGECITVWAAGRRRGRARGGVTRPRTPRVGMRAAPPSTAAAPSHPVMHPPIAAAAAVATWSASARTRAPPLLSSTWPRQTQVCARMSMCIPVCAPHATCGCPKCAAARASTYIRVCAPQCDLRISEYSQRQRRDLVCGCAGRRSGDRAVASRTRVLERERAGFHGGSGGRARRRVGRRVGRRGCVYAPARRYAFPCARMAICIPVCAPAWRCAFQCAAICMSEGARSRSQPRGLTRVCVSPHGDMHSTGPALRYAFPRALPVRVIDMLNEARVDMHYRMGARATSVNQNTARLPICIPVCARLPIYIPVCARDLRG